MKNQLSRTTTKPLSIKKIKTYFYLSLLLVNIILLFYSYLFIRDNIYYSINFDESNFPSNLRELSSIDMDKFNKVVKRIDEKRISKTEKIINFFPN